MISAALEWNMILSICHYQCTSCDRLPRKPQATMVKKRTLGGARQEAIDTSSAQYCLRAKRLLEPQRSQTIFVKRSWKLKKATHSGSLQRGVCVNYPSSSRKYPSTTWSFCQRFLRGTLSSYGILFEILWALACFLCLGACTHVALVVLWEVLARFMGLI